MICKGAIVSANESGLTITVPYDPRYVTQRWQEVEVNIPDGRRISPEQRRKAYALMGEIAEWSGMAPEEVKLTHKHEFVQRHLEGLHRELFSLADCDMTTARQFISYLIDFVLAFDVPLKVPLVSVCDDVKQAVYACLMHRRCIVCGQKCELHHVSRPTPLTSGGGYGPAEASPVLDPGRSMDHIGMRCLPLCREHHKEAHDHGDEALMAKYHLEPVEIDEKMVKRYMPGGKKHESISSSRRAGPPRGR